MKPLNILRLKRFTFFSTGILLLILEISISYFILSFLIGLPSTKSIGPLIAKWVLSIILAALAFIAQFISVLLLGNIGRPDSTIGLGEIIFIIFFKSKLVYHSELGYFVLLMEQSGVGIISLYEQKFFSMKHINHFEVLSSAEELSKRIKSDLDKLFSNKIKMKTYRLETEEKLKLVTEWDGYLDLQGKRDSKIDKLID